jgi:hypothetical protein
LLKPRGANPLLDRSNDHFSDPHWPYPDNLSSNHLLIMLHGAPEGCKGRLYSLVAQPGTLYQTSDPLDNFSPAETHVTSQLRFLH